MNRSEAQAKIAALYANEPPYTEEQLRNPGPTWPANIDYALRGEMLAQAQKYLLEEPTDETPNPKNSK